ncbi:MAG: Zn-binding domain-containing protein [Desulfobacterales bacterium]
MKQTAFWIEIPRLVQTAVEKEMLHFMGGIHAMEHAMIGVCPLLVLTDRNDFGGISTPFHPQVNGPAIFVYDAFPGGIGLSPGSLFSGGKIAGKNPAGCYFLPVRNRVSVLRAFPEMRVRQPPY